MSTFFFLVFLAVTLFLFGAGAVAYFKHEALVRREMRKLERELDAQ